MNEHGFSDVTPHEIIRRVSGNIVEIREMSAEKDPSWDPEIIPGGFSAHYVNQRDQKWFIKSNPDGEVKRVHKRKNGYFYYKGSNGSKFRESDKPIRFYDYNF